MGSDRSVKQTNVLFDNDVNFAITISLIEDVHRHFEVYQKFDTDETHISAQILKKYSFTTIRKT